MSFRKFIPTAVSFFLMSASAMAIEEPSYEVIATYDDFELRQYQPYLVAEVDVSGDFENTGNAAFRILAGYIFGDNEASVKMSMTAPVVSKASGKGEKMSMTAPVTATSAGGDGQMTYAFVMESQYTMETLPTPNDGRIRIREVPERIMAVCRYSGRWTLTKYRQNEELLRLALSNEGIEIAGDPILARYNSPFSLPMFRRNEVMFEIVGSGGKTSANPATG